MKVTRRTQYINRQLILIGIVLMIVAAAIMVYVSNRGNKTEERMISHALMQKTEGSELYEELVISSTEAAGIPVVTAQESSPYDGRFIANITDTLNVRAGASTEADVVGKMYPGCVGDIVGTDGDWTQITSGNVSGYVKTEYILTGKDAEPLAEEYGKNVGTVTADIIKVRREPSTESEAIAMLQENDQVNVTETLDGWYGILVNENWEGYVSADYLSVEYKLETAITIEEELAKIAAAKAAEAQAQASAGNAVTVGVTTQAPTPATYDDAYLLACLVSMESGNEPYEGQLAVANVVLNRLRSGAYGGSIYDVIYAPGQFPSVYGSVMTGYLNNGPLPQAQQAANEALAGVNNIGGYMCFINVRYANYAAYDSYTIIGNHCFH